MLHRLFIFLFFIVCGSAFGQCPQFYDNDGNLSSNPQWKFCDDAASTLNIQSDVDLGPYTIDWGDGNTDNGTGLTAGQIVSHGYPAGIQTYTITITVGGCTITGTYVKELPVKASIEVPPNGVTQVCAPGSMDFLNNSTGNSPNTTYFWDFGDGETLGPLTSANAGQTVTHTYQAGTVQCDTRVTLIAQNICSTRPSEATFEPVQIWDIDKPGIEANPRLLCWPDNQVTYTNRTDRNCALPAEGNTFQRYERWIFHDFFGPGLDSIIDWRPWPPSPPRTLEYPAPGTYEVTLMVRNFCGDATINTQITIIDAPEAQFTLDKDTICVGETATMTKTTGVPANIFRYTTGEGGYANFGNQNTRSFTYASPGDYEVGFAIDVADATPSCKDTVFIPIVVLPDPIADFTLNNDKACGNLDVIATDNSTDAVSWEWDFGNGFTFTGQNPPEVSYTTPGIYTIELTTVNAKNCTSTATKTVEVYSNPIPDFNGGAACLGQQYDFFGTANEDPNDPVISWDWNFGDGVTATGQNVNHIYFLDGNKNVTLIVSTANCTGTVTKTLSIESLPVASFSPDPTVGCAPFTVNFANTSNGASRYKWDFDDGNVDSLNANPSHEFFNASGNEVVRNVSLVALNAFGCSDTFERAVTVRPEINGDFDYLLTDNCSSVEVQFRNLTPNGTTFIWDFGDGSAPSNFENPLHEYVNNSQFRTTYTVTLTVTNAQGCTDIVTQEIEVTPAALFGFEGVPDATCTPAEIIFQAESGAVTYEWDFGDGTTANGQFAIKTFTNPGATARVYTVKLTAVTSEGCTDVVTQDITVYPKPNASFGTNSTAACSPFTVDINNTSSGGQNYIWSYGDGFTSGTAAAQHQYTYTNTTSANRDFTLSLEVISEHGCRDTATTNITVFPGIDAQLLGARNGCTPLTVNFSGSGGDSYQWDFGNGQTANQQNASTVFYHDGNPGPTRYVVQLQAISNNACNAVITDTVWVYPLPQSGFTPSTTQGCTPLDVSFIPQAVGATNYYWLFENGAGINNTGASVNYEYNNLTSSPRNYTPRLIVENNFGCVDTLEKSITVFPPVTAQAVYNDTACSPITVNFFNVSNGASSYVWDFGAFGATSEENPKETFFHNQSDFTTFPISLTASSVHGCSDVFNGTLTLYPLPNADFQVDALAGCQPFEVNFVNQSADAVSYRWNYGFGEQDTENATSFSRVFENVTANVQERNVQLIATNQYACTDTATQKIQVFPKVEAKFDDVSNGCSPLELLVKNESDGASFVTWTFSDGTQSTANQTAKVFNNTTPYDRNENVLLVATNAQGCTDSLRRDFVVYANPVATFTPNPIQQKYPDADVVFTNNTQGNTWSYQWYFGDESNTETTVNTQHTYATWGSYQVSLTATSSFCSDSVSKLIVIEPPAPVAQFSGTGDGCRPLTVSFVDQSQFAVNHYWDFGDGGSSPSANPTYTYFNPGTYSVTLTVTGPDGTSETVSSTNAVQVYENANAFFTSSPAQVFAREEPVDFLNLSSRADYYTWDFGDGNYSSEVNPSHFYDRVGVYDVILIADNVFGCPDTFKLNNVVRVIDGGFIDIPNAFTPNPTGPTGGRYNPNSLDNDVFFAFNKDVEDFKMEIFTRWGEKIFESRDVNIGWDGYSRGEMCQQDVYVYKVSATFEDGETYEKVGDVTLLR